ncbi:hypothetical protein C0583_02640 [Candidatus Parcubacteria bacterium]|nr:MAG: hypothetical protein C0583_02640 [Candidatus Parcubacteria bacterium]
MKAITRLSILIVLAVALSSCGKTLPNHAITDIGANISAPHPVELEKTNTDYVTIFPVFLDPALLTESVGMSGVYPTLGYDNDKIYHGYVYNWDISPDGDLVGLAIVAHKKSILMPAKFVVFNADAGYAYALTGEQLEYYPEKIDNKAYQKEFFSKNGQSLSSINQVWKNYLGRKSESIYDIKVGSEVWQAYRKEFETKFPNSYVMADGSVRSSVLEKEEFRMMATENPGYTVGQRVVKGFKISLFALPNLPYHTIDKVLAALIDSDWTARTARSKCVRYDLANEFRAVVKAYKKELDERNQVIKGLVNQLDLSK